MDNESPEHMYWKHARAKNGLYLNRRLFENAFEIASEEQVSAENCKDLKETKFKNKNVYLYGETGVGKTKLAKEIAKAVQERYIHW